MSFLRYIKAVLHQVQIQVPAVYDPHFFSGSFLRAFFTVESWMTSDEMLPANAPTSTFHVYQMVSMLQKYAGHQLLLSSNGLSFLEAKQVGTLLYYLFAMMDLTEGTFSDEQFASLILGSRLKVWSMLPDSATIHGLWHQAPLQAMYYWFASLQPLLEIENKWIKTLRFHPGQDCYHARDGDGTRFLLLDK
jgi:hypothetical protein